MVEVREWWSARDSRERATIWRAATHVSSCAAHRTRCPCGACRPHTHARSGAGAAAPDGEDRESALSTVIANHTTSLHHPAHPLTLMAVREKQLAALRAMLGGDAAGGAAAPWKVLVYCQAGEQIIAPLLNVGQLRELGVTLHLRLAAPRDPVPGAYFSPWVWWQGGGFIRQGFVLCWKEEHRGGGERERDGERAKPKPTVLHV